MVDPGDNDTSLTSANDIEDMSSTDHVQTTPQTEHRSKEITTLEGFFNFLADFMLVIGYSLYLVCQVDEYQNGSPYYWYRRRAGRRRLLIDPSYQSHTNSYLFVLYFVGFILLILSGLLELSVDTLRIRTVRHGRYSDRSNWNLFISLLFILAGVLDIIALFIIEPFAWMKEMFFLVSDYILLVMAVLIMPLHSWRETTIPDKIDFTANGVVLVVAILGVVFGHKELSSYDDGEAITRMGLALIPPPIWILSSLMYCVADVQRMYGDRRYKAPRPSTTASL